MKPIRFGCKSVYWHRGPDRPPKDDPETTARIRAAGKQAGRDVRAVFERKKRERDPASPPHSKSASTSPRSSSAIEGSRSW